MKSFTISFTNGATHNGAGGDTHPTSSTTFGVGGMLHSAVGVTTIGTTSEGTTSEGETTPPSEGKSN